MVLQKTLLQKITSASVASECTLTFFSFAKEACHHFIFSSGVVDNDEPPWFIVISLFFFSSVANDDELPWLVVISLFFFSSVKDDDKPRGLSSFFFS
jgi:hypothetical protein